MFVDKYGLERFDLNGHGDVGVCKYYDEMSSQNPSCDYYREAAKICRGERDLVNAATDAGLVHSWVTGGTNSSQSDTYNSIRQKLIFYDKQARQSGRVNSQGCTCGTMVDFYHDQAFEESGISPIFYGGNIWPQNTSPNPVPYDPRGGEFKDDFFN